MFAPTIHSASLYILLSLAASKGLEVVIKQADIKNAYLNTFLNNDKVIYLSLPPYYELFHSIPSELSKHSCKVVLCLCCPLYRTKQGAHHWYQELKRILISLNFKVSQANKALFYHVKGEKFVIMAFTTDDFTTVADSPQSSTQIKAEMGDFFQLINLGPINWLLGASVICKIKNCTISLSQETYVNQILTHVGLDNTKPVTTPMEPGVDLTPDSPSVLPKLLTPTKKTTYRKMIGLLMYLSTMTCPNITYAVSTLSQYLDSPHTTHFEAVK